MSIMGTFKERGSHETDSKVVYRDYEQYKGVYLILIFLSLCIPVVHRVDKADVGQEVVRDSPWPGVPEVCIVY